jgi:hypothetical protein
MMTVPCCIDILPPSDSGVSMKSDRDMSLTRIITASGCAVNGFTDFTDEIGSALNFICIVNEPRLMLFQ